MYFAGLCSQLIYLFDNGVKRRWDGIEGRHNPGFYPLAERPVRWSGQKIRLKDSMKCPWRCCGALCWHHIVKSGYTCWTGTGSPKIWNRSGDACRTNWLASLLLGWGWSLKLSKVAFLWLKSFQSWFTTWLLYFSLNSIWYTAYGTIR